MSEQLIARMKAFAEYASSCRDEKGEAQVFLDRLFQAMGHEGHKEAGARLETRVKRATGQMNFADLAWVDRRLLIEMKKRGEPLAKHFQQLRGYWLDTKGWRARYLVLCNFEEFWIYDTEINSDSPCAQVRTENLPAEWTALAFLHVDPMRPLFGYDRTKISAEAAEPIGELYLALVARGEDGDKVQRFLLQCVLAMFAEDFGLLTAKEFTQALVDCRNGQSTFDLLGQLFRQMNTQERAKAGRWKSVPYFNGGLFAVVDPVDLKTKELETLFKAAGRDWGKIDPSIFGTIFQNSMGEAERHASGAHYTTEEDIRKVVLPTIIRPWRQRIEATDSLAGLLALREEICTFKVLDPTCGSGNFLYVAYRELRRLELQILLKIRDLYPTNKAAHLACGVSVRQFYGYDILPHAVEVAKVTMMLAKELSNREMEDAFNARQITHFGLLDPALPLDNVSDVIRCADSLYEPWPEVDVIIGNPPFQSKNKMQGEFGPAAVKRLRAAFPDVPGRADYCVYFFRKAHDQLRPGSRAGFVGTNTIRQNYSREGGLDYIVANGGTIIEAVGTQNWSGDAAVHVSIVNWVKGSVSGPFSLKWEDETGHEHEVLLERIPSSLAATQDVATAKVLRVNSDPKSCFQGQTHGHKGFLMGRGEAEALLSANPDFAQVLRPFLTADEMLAEADGLPKRYVIDFQGHDIFAIKRFGSLYQRLQGEVLPDREAAAAAERVRNAELLDANSKVSVNRHHANFLSKWWQLSYAREDLVSRINTMPRYVVCGRVIKRPIFSFVHGHIRPNDAIVVFAFDDDYSFGILQSSAHWAWFTARCSTLKGDFRYTSNTVYDSFPWPQNPSVKSARAVADAAVKLRAARARVQRANGLSLRDLYRIAEQPGRNDIKDAQAALDLAVDAAYGRHPGSDMLGFLLDLNQACAASEVQGEPVTGPGLPPNAGVHSAFVTDDCIHMPAQVPAVQ